MDGGRCACAGVCSNAHVCVRVCVCACACACVCVYVCVCACLGVRVSVCLSVCLSVRVCENSMTVDRKESNACFLLFFAFFVCFL